MPAKAKKPTKQRTHVAFLIDESGSMLGNEEAIVFGYNDFVGALREDAGDTEVLATLAMFDLRGDASVCRVKFDAIPLAETTELTPADYRPHGSTPLNDAMLATIASLDRKVRKSDNAMGPDQFDEAAASLGSEIPEQGLSAAKP